MPRGDGIGPMGMGAMTGRGVGFCAGFKIPGFINPIIKTHMGLGMGCRAKRILMFSGLLSGCVYLASRRSNREGIKMKNLKGGDNYAKR